MVLGCHRSGTSAVARALNLLGLGLPKHLVGSGKGNDLGHWEPAAIVRFNDRLLESLDRSWFDPKPLPGGWRENLAEQQAEAIALWQAERAAGTATVFKDPRLSRLAPFWRDVLPAAPLAVIVCRNPFEVAASLNGRNGFDSRHGFLLWESYMLEAEAGTRGLRRMLVHYHDLLQRPLAVVEKLAAFAGSSNDVAAAAVSIDGAQPHHHEALEDFFENPKVPGPVKDIYRALLAPDALDNAGLFDRFMAEHQERWQALSPGSGPSPQALKRPETFFGRSQRALAGNQPELAVTEARRAMELDPKQAAYLAQLGKALAASGDADKAIEAFRDAATLAPGDSQLAYQLLKFLLSSGRPDEALAEARRAAKGFALDDRILLLCASAMIDGKVAGEAIMAIVQAMGLAGPSPEALLMMAAAVRLKGHGAAAAGHARQAWQLAVTQGRPDLQLQAGWLLYKYGDAAQAETVFRSLLAHPAHAIEAQMALDSLLRHAASRQAPAGKPI